MSLLSQVTKGIEPSPPRIFLYGSEGIGKSSFASCAPNPVFIQTEDGLGQINTSKFPLATKAQDVFQAVSDLTSQEHAFNTLVVDSCDWLERIVWDEICNQYGVTSIEKADGGYAKGYFHALGIWRTLVEALNELRAKRNMAIILVAHSKIEKFEDPESSAYDRYSPRLHKHVCALLTEWVDAVLFATVKKVTKTEDGGFNKKRTIATALGSDGGERIIRTVGGPSCIAKNRYNLPSELPLVWDALQDAMMKGVK